MKLAPFTTSAGPLILHMKGYNVYSAYDANRDICYTTFDHLQDFVTALEPYGIRPRQTQRMKPTVYVDYCFYGDAFLSDLQYAYMVPTIESLNLPIRTPEQAIAKAKTSDKVIPARLNDIAMILGVDVITSIIQLEDRVWSVQAGEHTFTVHVGENNVVRVTHNGKTLRISNLEYSKNPLYRVYCAEERLNETRWVAIKS